MKSEAPETLMFALRKVLDGGVYLSERMSRRLLPGSVRSCAGRRGIDPFDDLTSRESQVLQLVGQGKAPREISLEMSVSVKTVDTYLTHLRDKLHLNNRLQVVRYALGFVRDKAA
jgi:DNA-binding NarL/FixJ family response regulator